MTYYHVIIRLRFLIMHYTIVVWAELVTFFFLLLIIRGATPAQLSLRRALILAINV